MKARNVLPLGLWGIAIILVIAALRFAVMPSRQIMNEAVETVAPPSPPQTLDRELLAGHAAELRNRNPFRLERAPTAQAFSLWDPTATAPAPTEEPDAPGLPVLSIGGIIGGPPWGVVVEGVPGHETGVLIHAGEQSYGIRVEWIRNDSVGLSAQDTSWILGLKQLWHE